MGWSDVKKRISLPILTPEGITEIINSCLKKGGKNIQHSRTIIMDDYRRPTDDEKSISREEIEKIKIDIIRYMAQSLSKNYSDEDLNKNISQFIPGWNEKNPRLNLTIGELQQIVEMSDDSIRNLMIDDSAISSMRDFINITYKQCCSFEEEHNGDNPIYPFEKVAFNEKNTLWGYNKRLYLNPSLNNISTYRFLSEYIKKCIDRRIPFDMKGFGSITHSTSELDGMILYSSNRYFNSHIECLEEVIRENPEIMGTFGTPIYTGARVNDTNGESFYAIGAGFPCTYRTRTYNDYIDSAINLTYLISSARLIKQYCPVVGREYRELDNDTKELINKLNNLDQCSAEELQKIEAGLKEQKGIIRGLGYKIISYKKEKGTEQEKEEVMQKLKVTFSNNFKLVCSVLKFNDKEHIQTPIYEDGSFLDFEKMIEKYDSEKMPSAQENIYAEKCPADAIREYIEKIVQGQQEYIKSGKEIPDEMKIPSQIVLTPQNIQFLIDSEYVDYIGAGETGNEIQFFWKKVDEIPALEVRVKREENGKFYLTYIKEEASKEKDEFLWDRESADGKKGMITVSKKEEALEDICDMDRSR